ncbi:MULTISPECIES: hypothetical protein [Pectobacterium]|uniref:hypothetical protein n=1 Tax=Pectobacterium TaxID=122277 RepID=UPI000911F3F5|nr:hypothetical protein [Pectobacterium carotovorum]SHG93367.1 hypothetical protein SAMN05444147_105132 [Pectobacterium carotovorum]
MHSSVIICNDISTTLLQCNYYPYKISTHTTKSALHRTRLRFSDHKNFSVFFFYKPTRQPAPLLGLCIPMPTEIIEKNFSFFQFWRFLSVQKLAKNYTIYLNLKTGYYFTWRGEKNQAEKRMCSRSGNPLQDAAYRWAEVLEPLKNVNSQAQKNPTGEVGLFHDAWDSLPQIKRG